MIGFVYKDFLVMRKQLGYYLMFIAIYAGLTIAGVFGPYVLPAIVVVVGMMLPMSSMSYDDLARWDKYAAATPTGRSGIVGGKYFFTLLAMLIGGVLVVALMAVLSLLGLVEIALTEALLTTAACVGVGVLIDAVILPLLFKFGSEKSRTITMILFVVIFGGVFLASSAMEKGGALPVVPDWVISALPVVMVLVAVGGYAVSYFISIGIMQKKEL